MKLALALCLLSGTALAAADAGVSCVEVEQRLATAQRLLATCTDASRAHVTARERCEAELEESSDRATSTAAKLEACVTQREGLCDEAAAFAASLLQGTTRTIGACVPPATQTQIQALLTSWAQVSRLAGQLDDYLTGSSEVVPRLSGLSDTERRLGRVLGKSGSPLWNRRLLISAFKLTAPNAWQKLRAQGAVAIDAFFEGRGPLGEAFIAEANAEHSEPAGPAGPPLTAALRLTLSYLVMAQCDLHAESRECGRARQLVELLDDAGPLIIRRRVEEMFATPCNGIVPDTVRAWLQDFPTSQSKDKASALETLASAARSKMFHCYLSDAEGEAGYATWVAARLPTQKQLDGRMLPLLDGFQQYVREGDPMDRCGRAVRAMQRAEAKGCGFERPETLTTISLWSHTPLPSSASPDMQVCQKIATLLWSGSALELPASPEEQVKVDPDGEGPMAALRRACDEREGENGRFEQGLAALGAIAKELQEPTVASPWRLDAAGTLPAERVAYEDAESYASWLEHVVNQESPCDALSLSEARCEACRDGASAYDCALNRELETLWLRYRRVSIAVAVGLAVLVALVSYARRLLRARRVYGKPMTAIRQSLEGLGLRASPDALRVVFPSRHDVLELELPKTPAWERWGTEALAVLSADPTALREADVNHAASIALKENVRVAFLLHPDTAVPDLGAVRATLDWAARGGTKAVQILPLALSRLAWATRDEDLLDLVEATTLRGNPFEVRGPVRSSSQFWNRERLVAGLLTESRAGHWVVITGLRRFGKSSLALEVARRTTGPSAYVDLAGFHHEVSHGETPAVAVEAILRTLVTRLVDSATARFPAATIPPIPTGALDAPALAAWLRALSLACGTSSGASPPPMLLVLDEVEQLLSAQPDKLGRALDVMATLVGRLRSAFSEPSSPHAGSTVSVVLCAALHPLLWAPLSTLGGQSLMGAFPSICVPALDDDAAHAMMRGLGARQGIRFEDDALSALVKASHGVPLLLRRLGTSVLELYDADRARQGALGAVRVGIEGATEAIRREERGGSPLRVWVESEIAQSDSTAGVLLRALANQGKVSVEALQTLVFAQVMERFSATGLTSHLEPSELKRRAQEAASVMVRLLAESRLLESHGDITSPEAYSLPDGVLRRILTEGRKP